MKIPIKILSVQTLLDNAKWEEFLTYQSQSFLDKDSEGNPAIQAVVILSSPQLTSLSQDQISESLPLQELDLKIIDKKQISTISFSNSDSKPLWSDSECDSQNALQKSKSSPTPSLINSRLRTLFEMLNGKIDKSKIKAAPLFAWQ